MFVNAVAVETRCPFCGDVTLVFVDPSDLVRYQNGEASVQDCFPYLSADEREMLMTGICPTCWENTFGEEEDPCEDCDGDDLEMGFNPYEGGYDFDC